MGQRYEQLSLAERCEIARLHGSGTSIRQIAAALDRPASTISRELKRNQGSGPAGRTLQAGLRPGSGERSALEGRQA